MHGLLKPGDPGVVDDCGLIYKQLSRPADKQSVAEAEKKIKECVDYRFERERRLQALTAELNQARESQSRWRVTN